MAFQQPTRPAVQRVTRPATVDEHDAAVQARASPERQPEESHTWVLFSPPTDVTTVSYLSETEHSLDTPGRSRLSDLGSLNTVARSAQHTSAECGPSLSAADGLSTEDDAELDILDSHLPEFRSLPGAKVLSQRGSQHALPVLPAHDDLGSFHLDRPILGREAQDQIYQFERFNPRRVRWRLDSLDRDQLELGHRQIHEDEKRLRIEAWRLEHSRVLLDEVQREAKRRRKSQESIHRFHRSGDAEPDMTWHDEDHIQPEEQEEGILTSITRKLVRDLLGIDDRLLSVLLDESLPEVEDTFSATLRASQMSGQSFLTRAQGSPWHIHILETLSRELGLLANHISHHPGAFSTYPRAQQMELLPYVGLAVIPESRDAPRAHKMMEPERPSQLSAPDFQPTIRQQPQPTNISGQMTEDTSGDRRDDTKMDNTFTEEEWERELDAKLMFRYLISRFTSRPKSPSSTSGSHIGTPTAQDRSVKTTRHHPLIPRSRPAERRAFKATMVTGPSVLRHHSSCASQSTRRSARRSSCSSRHYWDIGGSLGTGSMVASIGPMGSWGEV